MIHLSENSAIKSLVNISYGRLCQATEGFSPNNLIGQGSFGSVYKGSLDEIEKPIAIKVLNLEQEGAFKSIMAECNALRNIRHRNLVKLITYCSSLDYKGNEFKALVFEFMENGSLEKWLHPTNDDGNQLCKLTLLQRLNIAIDVASAVHYLHDLCGRVIIHCDLKPSNILRHREQITNDPNGIFNSWNQSQHYCNWTGVTCSRRHPDRVISLVLEGQQIAGTISPRISNLSFLRLISISDNTFRGTIPEEIGNLFRLRFIRFTNNSLEGEIPANLTHCSQIRRLYFAGNRLIGRIPAYLGSFQMLEVIEFRSNNLTGAIPPSLANLSKLIAFDGAYNNLVGTIPDDMGLLRSLEYFNVGVNNISGTFPSSLLNLSSIAYLSLPGNKFHGSLPQNIGLTIPNLGSRFEKGS